MKNTISVRPKKYRPGFFISITLTMRYHLSMKTVLFVCHANVTRSQMAAAFFNKDAPAGWHAVSAGTDVKTEDGAESADGRMLKDTPATVYIFATMEEYGIDMGGNIRYQVTPNMVEEADVVIALVPRETCPDFMRNSPKTVYWNVEDVTNVSLKEFKKVRERIRPLVAQFIESL